MLASDSIDKKITTLLPSLSIKQKKTVLNVVKTFVEDDAWRDESFIKEMDRRTEEYENGKAKTFSLTQLEQKARANFKKAK